MIEKIRLWWKFEARYYLKNLIQGIKNLYSWFPIIYNDRDWDYHFIYEVLIHKLEKQATYIHKYGNHVSAERDAEKMFLCARLARIQQEELYMDEYYDTHEMEFEFVPTDETEQWFTMESKILSENFTDYLYKYHHQYKLIDKTDLDKQEIAVTIARNNQERSRKLLFKIMEENIERWWN
jgi:hypothetical protein